MDVLETIGRTLARPQYFIVMVVAVVLIGIGLYAIYNSFMPPLEPGDTPNTARLIGLGVISVGVLIGYIGRRSYKLIRKHGRYARMAGVFDIIDLLK